MPREEIDRGPRSRRGEPETGDQRGRAQNAKKKSHDFFAICLNPSKDPAPAALQGLLPPVSAKPQKPGLGRPWLALAGLVRVLFEQPRILPRSNPTPQFESAQRFCSPFFRRGCVITLRHQKIYPSAERKFPPPQRERIFFGAVALIPLL